MKVTNELRKAINAGVRRLCGANPLAEVGMRRAEDDRVVANALLWHKESDLFDFCRLASLRDIEDDPTLPGCATLDLYVTSGRGSSRELETNVYVTIKDGQLVDIHTQDLESDKRTMALIGRRFSPLE